MEASADAARGPEKRVTQEAKPSRLPVFTPSTTTSSSSTINGRGLLICSSASTPAARAAAAAAATAAPSSELCPLAAVAATPTIFRRPFVRPKLATAQPGPSPPAPAPAPSPPPPAGRAVAAPVLTARRATGGLLRKPAPGSGRKGLLLRSNPVSSSLQAPPAATETGKRAAGDDHDGPALQVPGLKRPRPAQHPPILQLPMASTAATAPLKACSVAASASALAGASVTEPVVPAAASTAPAPAMAYLEGTAPTTKLSPAAGIPATVAGTHAASTGPDAAKAAGGELDDTTPAGTLAHPLPAAAAAAPMEPDAAQEPAAACPPPPGASPPPPALQHLPVPDMAPLAADAAQPASANGSGPSLMLPGVRELSAGLPRLQLGVTQLPLSELPALVSTRCMQRVLQHSVPRRQPFDGGALAPAAPSSITWLVAQEACSSIRQDLRQPTKEKPVSGSLLQRGDARNSSVEQPPEQPACVSLPAFDEYEHVFGLMASLLQW